MTAQDDVGEGVEGAAGDALAAAVEEAAGTPQHLGGRAAG